jgi:ABC-type glutathione transport system ATPase component
MRADQILVVMDGEIVEAGTHQSLIHSKGKYHDLWAKQIFVKPSDERSRSRSPRKQDATIVNDLSPAKQNVELAKVLNTTEHDCESAIDGEVKKSEGKKKESSHQREVSSSIT